MSRKINEIKKQTDTRQQIYFLCNELNLQLQKLFSDLEE